MKKGTQSGGKDRNQIRSAVQKAHMNHPAVTRKRRGKGGIKQAVHALWVGGWEKKEKRGKEACQTGREQTKRGKVRGCSLKYPEKIEGGRGRPPQRP